MISQSFKYGWDKFRDNVKISLLATLITLAIGSLVGGEDGPWGRAPGGVIGAIVLAILLMVVRIGYNKMFLRIHDGEKPPLEDLFKEYRLFWKFLGNSILYPLTIFGGLILLVVPGIIWAVRFSFSPLIVVDAKAGPVQAMKESYAITQGKFWQTLFFWICVMLLNIVGLLALGIGLLVTVPVSTFASVWVYRELSRQRASIKAPETAPVIHI